MLIENGILNIDEFRQLVPTLKWEQAPRWLNKDHKEIFYIAFYEDDKKEIEITIRPSLRMAINESFKNYTIHGNPAPEDYKGNLVKFGTTIEVLIDNDFLEEIKKIATPMEPINAPIQKINWK